MSFVKVSDDMRGIFNASDEEVTGTFGGTGLQRRKIGGLAAPSALAAVSAGADGAVVLHEALSA